jgi:hypothetical protein
MGWTVRGSNPSRGEIFRACPDQPWHPPSRTYNGYRVFLVGEVRPGVLLNTHPLLVPRSWKSRAEPLPTLWPHRACNGVTLPLPFYPQYGVTTQKIVERFVVHSKAHKVIAGFFSKSRSGGDVEVQLPS